MSPKFSNLLKSLSAGIARDARSRFDYPEVTEASCQRRFEEARTNFSKVQKLLQANQRRLDDHQSWLALENKRAEEVTFDSLRQRTEIRVPRIEASLVELQLALQAAQSLSHQCSRLLLDVQVLIKSPIAGLKTLSEKTSSLAEAITRASDQLRVLKDDLTSLIAGEVAWAQVDKAGLQVFSGFESLGLTQLIAYGYGPGHPISLRIRALARLRDWAKATDCLEFEATVESHLAFCKLERNLADLGETLAEAAVEAASTSTFSTREFFAVCNLSKTNDHVLARDLSLVCINSISKLIPLVGKAEPIWDAQFSWFNESL